MLTSRQKNFYEDNGYLMVEDVITKDQLNKLQEITYDFIECSRQVTANDDVFDLDAVSYTHLTLPTICSV